MPVVVPSFVAKVARAKKHLVELDAEVRRFAETHPYTVSESVEGKKKRKVRRLAFTADPANTEIPMVAADAIYNLRSALDHLMSSLVARNHRGSAIFPVFFEGVWNPGVPGENAQRAKERARWASDTKTARDEAVAILKRLQPPDDPGQQDEPSFLPLVNRLSNRDRHEKLPVVVGGMSSATLNFTAADGRQISGPLDPEPGYVLQSDAEIHDVPHDALDVQVQGVPLVGIKVGSERLIALPEKLGVLIAYVETDVIAPLLPYVRI
jgi:hypothetical protein